MTEPSYVVVLITPAGQVMISRPSLMTADEAEHEAGIWRTSDPDSSGRPWRAIVRDLAGDLGEAS